MKIKCVLFAVFLISTAVMAQQSVNSGGGSATGSGGVVTFTTGQSAFTIAESGGGSSSAGVQQAYIITQTGTQHPNIAISVKVFPNPTHHLLQIDAGETRELRYQLTEAAGKTVSSGKIKNGKATLDLASTAPGNYRLIVWQKDQQIQSFSIIKNNL